MVADNLRDVLVLQCTRRSDPVHGSPFRPGEGGVRAASAAPRWFTGNKNLRRRKRAGRPSDSPARRPHHSRLATLATARATLGERILTGLISPTFRPSPRLLDRSLFSRNIRQRCWRGNQPGAFFKKRRARQDSNLRPSAWKAEKRPSWDSATTYSQESYLPDLPPWGENKVVRLRRMRPWAETKAY